MSRCLFVCGAAGFIGSNFVRHLMDTDWRVVSLDKLTYAGLRENLSPFLGHDRHDFVHGAIEDSALLHGLLRKHRPHAIVNLAAESHVDRSIDAPVDFVETNIVGVFRLLDVVMAYLVECNRAERDAFRFVQVSSDEVYGSIKTGAFTEQSPFRPNSPYAASKASGDCLARAYHRTYGVPTVISNCSNNYGPFQFPEKLIPLMIVKALSGEALPVYGDGRQKRDWIHVADHCAALEQLVERGEPGETYNVGGGCSIENIDLVQQICATLDRLAPRAKGSHAEAIKHVEDRPGHDRHYQIDHTKITESLGWRPMRSIEDGLESTVRWYLENKSWLERVRSRGHRGQRLGLERLGK